MIAMVLRFTLVCMLFGAAIAVAAPARAEERPTLRPHISVSRDVVTVGDFFDHAGVLASEPLFRAPDLGEVGTIEAWRVIDAAGLAGLTDISSGGHREITVTRKSVSVSTDDITRLIIDTIADRTRTVDRDALAVTYAGTPPVFEANPNAIEPIRLISLQWSRRSGRFGADVIVDLGDKKQHVRLTGTAREMVEVATLARPYARDEVVSRDDIIIERVPRDRANASFIVSPEKIAGMAARRNLRANTPLAATDFTKPMLVKRGDLVTIVYRSPGLTLTVRGQAQESGAAGDMVNVLNSQSRRVVRTRVLGRGKVTVSSQRRRIFKVSEATN